MKMMWEDVSYYIWQATMFQKINNDIISCYEGIIRVWKVSCKILSKSYKWLKCYAIDDYPNFSSYFKERFIS